jgi:hypothetical protein
MIFLFHRQADTLGMSLSRNTSKKFSRKALVTLLTEDLLNSYEKQIKKWEPPDNFSSLLTYGGYYFCFLKIKHHHFTQMLQISSMSHTWVVYSVSFVIFLLVTFSKDDGLSGLLSFFINIIWLEGSSLCISWNYFIFIYSKISKNTILIQLRNWTLT